MGRRVFCLQSMINYCRICVRPGILEWHRNSIGFQPEIPTFRSKWNYSSQTHASHTHVHRNDGRIVFEQKHIVLAILCGGREPIGIFNMSMICKHICMLLNTWPLAVCATISQIDFGQICCYYYYTVQHIVNAPQPHPVVMPGTRARGLCER